MAKTLTDKAVENLKAPPKCCDKKCEGRHVEPDALVPGLQLRVTAKGVKSWYLVYRIKGQDGQCRKYLGTYPAVSVAEARKLGAAVKDAARAGQDLLAEREAEVQREQAERDARKTFGDVVSDYIKREIPSLRRGADIQAVIERELVDWYPLPVEEITPAHVIEVTDRLLDEGKPAAANKAFEIIRRVFNWAIKRRVYGLDYSPVDRMDSPAAKVQRDRVLSNAEIKQVWEAGTEYPFGPFVRFLLLTGQRRDEVAGLRWDEIENGVWTIPTERCKSKRPHVVPLPRQAIELLEALPRFAGPYVFTTTSGQRPISGYSKSKARFDNAAGLDKPWRLHDLRRTMRTGLAKLNVPDTVAEKVLNHSPRGLQAIYDQHRYQEQKADALAKWANHLDGIVSPEPDRVVQLHG